ncbi:MAG: hypothetical protein WA918_05450, partial [Erythrobacter sp.]
MDIYDRSRWPLPETNPILALLDSERDWFTNRQVVVALGLVPTRALLSTNAAFKRQLNDDDTGFERGGRIYLGKTINAS